MNILAWLRKLGHDRFGPVFRSIDIVGLLGPKAANLRELSGTFVSQRHVLLSAIALPKERPATPKRPPNTPRVDRSPARLKILDNELEPARSTVATRSSRAPEQRRPTPFVGRETELRRLLDARSQAAAGHGQVVLLSGDAGVGKSRIVREVSARHFHTVLWHRCSPEHAFSPLHPVIGLLQQLPGLPEAEGFELDCGDEPVVAMADLLGSDDHVRGRPCGSTPQRLRSRTFEILLGRIEQMAQQGSVLAVYEDLQWADPSTLEFLDRLVERIADLPVLAIMTCRPEFEAVWHGHAHAVPLALTSLERGPCRAMIHHLSAGETLAEPVPEHIIECSGGVPLLVEELTKAALEVGDEVHQSEGADATPWVAIPSTLREGLTVRLGPDSDATLIVQAAAVIGCEFSQELLAAVVGWPQDQLQPALDRLVASALVLRSGAARDGIWAFKHALIRDAVYDGIAEPLRRKLHGSIAEILEARSPEVAASTPGVLAQHYAAAGLPEPAVAYWLHAGKRASEGCAQTEAIAMFSKGLDLLDGLPAASESRTQRAELLAALAQTLTVTKGLAAPEVAKACGMALTLCQNAEEDSRLFPAVRSLWEYYNTRADFEAACELAGRCQKLAAHAQEPNLMTEADFCLGVSSLFAGQLAVGRERLNRSVVRFEARGRRAPAANDMRDPRTIAFVHLAQALWLCGCPDQALRASQEAVETARAAGHPFALTYALLGASWVSQFRREVDATRALATDAMACATEEGFPAFLAMARILRDWTSIGSEAAGRAATTAIRTALEDYRATGVEIARPYLLGLLAELHGRLLETEPALELLDEAANVAHATGERWYEPEIRRQEGELLLRQSITNRRIASARFCQAIAVAQQQGGKSLELRAAVSLARLWADVGRRSQARDVLAPIYSWFHEGFETADLKDAMTLLDELQ
jgi:predicted ATPase